MKEQLRACQNKSCRQFEIPHLFQRTKKCQDCGRKTVFIEDYVDGISNDFGDDTPPASYVDGQKGLVLLGDGRKNAPEEEKPLLFGAAGDSEETLFDCDLEGCPELTANEVPLVLVPWMLYQRWVYLATKLDVEWIAFLKGTLHPEGENDLPAYYEFFLDGMSFPNQVVTSTHCQPESMAKEEADMLGKVHSHVDMPASFSGEDHRHFSAPVEIVVNRSGKVGCVVRVPLKCGKFERVKQDVEITALPEMKQCLAALMEKLVVRKESQPSTKGGAIYRTDLPQHYQQVTVTSSKQAGGDPNGVHGLNFDKGGEPSDQLLDAALKVLRRSSKFNEAEKDYVTRVRHGARNF